MKSLTFRLENAQFFASSLLAPHCDLDCIPTGVDNVGTVPAALLTYASIQAIKPDLIINMGTAGGFKVYIPLLF